MDLLVADLSIPIIPLKVPVVVKTIPCEGTHRCRSYPEIVVHSVRYGLFRCVQDLTCVGASLIHSAGLAAHIPGVAAIESNGRQYCPAANAPWDAKFPGVFTIKDGTMHTAILNGLGLGAV